MNDSQETFILNFGGGDVKEAFKNVLAFQDELEQGEAMISAMTHFLTTHPNIEGAVGEGVPYRLAFKIVPDRGGDGFLIESGFLLPAFDFRHREVAVNAGFAVNNSGYLKLFSGGKLIVGFVLPFRGVLFFDFQSAVIFNSQIMIDKYRSAVMREERSKFFLAAMMTDVLPKIIPSYKPSWTNGLEEAIEYKFEQCGE
jgi:hypothetical protein